MNLIDHLPRNSLMVEAQLSDPEYAAMLAAHPSQKTPGERIAEWSAEREALAQLRDAVNVNTQAVIAAAGGKPQPVKPTVRPITELDRAKAAKRRADHEALVARVLPGRTKPN